MYNAANIGVAKPEEIKFWDCRHRSDDTNEMDLRK
jgi:hypothetical protein